MAADQSRAQTDAGHPLLQRLIDSIEIIEIIDGQACWDYAVMYDIRDRLAAEQASAQAAPTWLQQFANAVRDGIASHAADNWPTRKFSLQEIENGIGAIEINAAMVYAAIRTPSTAGGGVGEAL